MRPDRVEIGLQVESAFGLDLLNGAARLKRQAAFRLDAPRRPNDLRLISDGDSWYLHPLLEDVVNHLYARHLIYSLDGAGDEMGDIARQKQALAHIDRLQARGVMLSGGGNDLLGGGALKGILKKARGSAEPAAYINEAALAARLGQVMRGYEAYVGEIRARHSHVHVFLHGYDYAIPVPGGRWLGGPMSGIVPPAAQQAVVALLMDRFNDALASFAEAQGGTVHYVNVRNTVDGRWSDELHPTGDGYFSVAEKLDARIQAALAPSVWMPGGRAARERNGGRAEGGTKLPPLADHMLAPVGEVYARNANRRRAAHLVADGLAKQIIDGTERAEFVLPPTGVEVEVTIGEPDFRPARFLRDGAERARAVCRIVLPGGSGTGSLLRGGFILTNHHVLPTAETARSAVAEFGFEDGTDVVTVTLHPERFFLSNAPRDFAIVACDPDPVRDVVSLVLPLTPNQFRVGERANIVQHPRGRPKEVAFRDNRITEIFQGALHYRTDTEPGSSGSPVFNDDWQLIGLHRAGLENQFNQAIRIDAIAAFLESQLRGEGESAAPEAMRFLAGTSPHLGFFGRAGIVSELRPEVEIPTFRGDAEFADIGFWNIENFFGNVSSAHVRRIAGLLSDLNMDAIGLIEVGRDAVQRTVAEMRRRGENTGHVFLDTEDSRDLAILFDRDTAEVTLMNDVVQRHRDLIDERIEGKTVFPRAPLIARVRVGEPGDDGVEFAMIVIHLKSKAGRNRALSARRRARAAESLRVIADDIRRSEGLPVVLGGDYNEELSNDVLAGLTDAPDFFTLTKDDEFDGAVSFLSPRYRSLIDHVIVAGDLDIGDIHGDDLAIVRFDQSISDFDSLFSDHTPLVMRLILRDEAIDVPGDEHPPDDDGMTIEIPADAEAVNLRFS